MFELLFKYPLGIFHKGTFVFLTPWPLWLMAIGILAAGGLLFWQVRRSHGMLSGLRPIAIWVLETCMVALILFLLWHPALSVATLRPQQNVVAVLVDDSRSMAIADSSGTREAAAKSILDSGLLKALGQKFQVRLYKFGKEPARVPNLDTVTGTEPATRIGDTLERVLAESSSLPLGAIVLLSDGADNSGGIDLATIEAIRRQRIPVHTIGFGKEHPDRDVEVTDAVIAPRALPKSRLTAIVSLQSYGLSGTKSKIVIRDSGKVLASQDVTLKADGEPQTEAIAFNVGEAGPKTLDISVQPAAGEQNTQNNAISRVVNVENRKPKILYFDGEEQWEYKFIRRAVQDYPDLGIELASIDRVTENKLLTQLDLAPSLGKNDLADGFPAKAEDLFPFQAVIIGSTEANYFTATQQQLIRDFVDKRGGGLLFTGGRHALSDGGYQSSPMNDLMPTKLPASAGTFHRAQTPVELTAQGAQSIITRLDDDPAKNVARWKTIPLLADWEEVGEPKPGATTLLVSHPQGKAPQPLLVTENYGRGRTAVMATSGSWRWKMWLDHADKTHATFWQQLMRYLVTDTPGQVTASTPKQMLSDDTRVPIRVEVRDKQFNPVTNAKVQARFTEPDGSMATLELTPQPLEEGVYAGEWSAEKTGSYVAEIIAGREQEELGRDVLAFRREDGVAENFHTSQNRELLEKLSEQTGGRYYTPGDASKLATEISYSEAGITTRETRDLWDMPVLFLLVLSLRASEWLLRRRWGVV
jgi:uncharacterized membrane protein